MQEIPDFVRLNPQQVTCLGNSSSNILFCASSQCKQYAIICMNKNCSFCSQSQGKNASTPHRQCFFISAKSLIQDIQKNRLPLTQFAQDTFTAMDMMYSQAIDMIQRDRQQMFKLKDNYGLRYQQAFFLQSIKNKQDKQYMNGKNVKWIKQGLNRKNQPLVGGIQVLGLWQQQKKIFQNVLRKMKGFRFSKNKSTSLNSNVRQALQQLISQRTIKKQSMPKQQQEDAEITDLFD